jgi:DNA-binding protein HU-beta
MATKPTTTAKTTAPAKKSAKSATKTSAAKKTAAKPTATRKIEVITLKTLFEQSAGSQELSKKQGHAMLEEIVDLMTTHLVRGDKIRMSGIGVLEVKNRAARLGRNPAAGETIQIAASKKIAFRAAKELKAAV